MEGDKGKGRDRGESSEGRDGRVRERREGWKDSGERRKCVMRGAIVEKENGERKGKEEWDREAWGR